MSKTKCHVISAVITLVVAAVGFYFALPAISFRNIELYIDIIILCAIYSVAYLVLSSRSSVIEVTGSKNPVIGFFKPVKIAVIIALVCVLVIIIGSLIGAVIFNASRYQKLLTVETGDFTEDVAQISYNQIPTLDKDSAAILGNRKMGELSDMVSQFAVMDEYYTQINIKGQPVRVTPLEYVDIFKWFNNVKNGTPGYIQIDMVSQEVTLVRLDEGIKYSVADHFHRNLKRHIRFKYPTFIFDSPTFEVDDNGTPYWVCPRVQYRIGLFSGKDINGAVLVNAVTGECEYYTKDEVPSWVDRVYNADLIIEQYDYYGTLKHGYFNSIFGQKDSQVTTDGYNYLAMDDDVYMYTGVTSVTSDQSNIGFILCNQRTKETKFYEIPGATEYSAMNSAEGEVQNLRYTATFPLLLNIGDEPTYFIALKDAAGLVKRYAMVNVQQYQIVAQGDSLMECENNYIQLIKAAGISDGGNSAAQNLEYTGTITEIRTAVVDSNSQYYFIVDGAPKIFTMSVKDDNNIIVLNVGDSIKVTYEQTENAIAKAVSIERQ